MASARIQRWALTLVAYNYKVQYKPGKDISHADVLSCLPLPNCPNEVPTPGELVLLLENLQTSPVRAHQIKQWTDKDPVLSKVCKLILQGWPNHVEEELRSYFRRKLELSIQDGCIMWGSCVVVPPPGRGKLIDLLHEGHPGTSRMKSLARSYVWWPNIDEEVEAMVKQCNQCQIHHSSPAPAPSHPWEWPERPWTRLHADYAGPFMGNFFDCNGCLLQVDGSGSC